MTIENDPWDRWYADYIAGRVAIRKAKLSIQERSRTANRVAGLLFVYMLIGGFVASVAVGLVMAN